MSLEGVPERSSKSVWIEGGIDIPEGALELDEYAIRQAREKITRAVSEQLPDYPPEDRLMVIDDAMASVVSQFNNQLSTAGGMSDEAGISVLSIKHYAGESGEV